MGQQREGRQWKVLASDFDFDEEFRARVVSELADLEPMLFRLGRGFIVAPLRVQDNDGEYVTVGVAIRETFMPAVRAASHVEKSEQTSESDADAELSMDEIAHHFPEQEPVEAQ